MKNEINLNNFLSNKKEDEKEKILAELSKEVTYKNNDGNEIEILKAQYLEILLKNGASVIDNKLYELNKKNGEVRKRHSLVLSEKELEYISYLLNGNDNIEDDRADYSENEPDETLNKGTDGANFDNAADSEDAADAESIPNSKSDNRNRSIDKEKNEFDLWLMKESEKYCNEEYEKIMKEVFENELGEFDSSNKSLLVLIENIDEPLCKKELKNRLWNSNISSRKIFELITGLELPTTNLDTNRYLDLLTHKDFRKPKEYEPLKAANHSQEKTFYIKTDDDFIKVEGYEYPHPKLDLFIRYSPNEVVISDIRSGLRLVSGTNEAEATKKLEEKLDETGVDKVIEALSSLQANPAYYEK